jgi:hypothetical protein
MRRNEPIKASQKNSKVLVRNWWRDRAINS